MSDRGTGRTSRQLADLPDGSFYLVPNQVHADHCKDLLRAAGRRPSAIRFVTATQSEQGIWGIRVRSWDVDHAYFEVAGARGRRNYDVLAMAAAAFPPGEASSTAS